LKGEYTHTVGAPAYAAPEAFCGLAGHRQIAPYTDIYAIGCLLFQLFNKDLFSLELSNRNPSYQYVLNLMIHEIGKYKTLDERATAWRKTIRTFTGSIARVHICAAGNSVPPGIRLQLDSLLAQLTHPDFTRRPLNLERVRQQVWIAIRVTENQAAERWRLEQAKKRRALRLEKIQRREAKLEEYLRRAKQAAC
jgi:serine/threonine protein kinase